MDGNGTRAFMYDWVYVYEFEGNLGAKISPLKEDEDYLGFWKEADYSYLFFGKDKKALLQRVLPPFRSETVLRHEDWEAGNPLDILRVGRITVHPPWKTPRVNKKVSLAIDPGMAFGSGYHATTKGCLILLEKLFKKSIPAKVLDLGTGTGILSIASLKMGARAAFSLDYNNLAIDTAKKNRGLNGLENQMHLWMGDARDFLYIDADLLIANLFFQTIDQLTDQEVFFSKSYYLLSGLLGHEGYRVQEKLQKRLTLLDTYQENFWFSYLFRHPQLASPETS
jgi:ribosomal protein L11 methyltransferase